ncbi:MAG: uroporphyrinogen decarboxylase family protein, partial [Acidobacteriota bacterium]
MRIEQWELFKKVAKSGQADRVPCSLIFDSPWMPGYLGISHVDYYFDPEVWFNSNLKILKDFPDVIVFPSWWAEYGMAIEPSALGCRIHFAENQPPSQIPNLLRLEDLDEFQPVDVVADGLMCAALHRYRTLKKRIHEAGYTIPVVTARGPLCTASFMRGVTTFMMDLIDNPDGVHELLAYITDATIRWLKAQAEAIGDSVEGVFILDDIPGFLSRQHYLEFAHPYLKQIFDAFPKDWVKVYHNDASIGPFLEDLADVGFDVLNWTFKIEPEEVRKRTNGKIRLMGNVPPLDIGVRGSPQDVKTATLNLLRRVGREGTILSLGGGVSTGMPGANI